MKKIHEIEIGFRFEHPTKGEGTIIGKTKKSLTAKFQKSTTKVVYNSNEAFFSEYNF